MNVFLRGLFFVVIIGVVFTGVITFLFPAPCAKPIAYSIGELDSRFGLSNDQFLQHILSAEKLWEKEAGKELFTYDPKAQFTINLKYDERQATADKAKTITKSLESTSKAHDSVLGKYKTARVAYETARVLYERHTKELNVVADAFRTTVEAYNKSGGAPPDEYQQLRQEQKRITDLSEALEQERVSLNEIVARVNSFADSESSIVKTYNDVVEKFNDEFAYHREFDQGEYTGNAITIYEFNRKNDLVLVLTHELGHTLGIGHLQSPTAIMHYMANDKNLNAKKLTPYDISALEAQCNKDQFTVFVERLKQVDIRSMIEQIFIL